MKGSPVVIEVLDDSAAVGAWGAWFAKALGRLAAAMPAHCAGLMQEAFAGLSALPDAGAQVATALAMEGLAEGLSQPTSPPPAPGWVDEALALAGAVAVAPSMCIAIGKGDGASAARCQLPAGHGAHVAHPSQPNPSGAWWEPHELSPGACVHGIDKRDAACCDPLTLSGPISRPHALAGCSDRELHNAAEALREYAGMAANHGKPDVDIDCRTVRRVILIVARERA